jgi:hypothetical protein
MWKEWEQPQIKDQQEAETLSLAAFKDLSAASNHVGLEAAPSSVAPWWELIPSQHLDCSLTMNPAKLWLDSSLCSFSFLTF